MRTFTDVKIQRKACTKEASCSRALPLHSHPRCHRESRGWGQAKLGHSSSSDSGWKEYSPEIRKLSVWWAGLPALCYSPNALTKQQDKKCFLGYSWLKTQEENILVCPQKTMKACCCLGRRTGPVQSWDLAVTGSAVEKQWKCINLLDFPAPAGRRAAHSRELNTVSAPHRDCAVD